MSKCRRNNAEPLYRCAFCNPCRTSQYYTKLNAAFYGPQLREWIKHFEKILVLRLEDLFDNRERVVKEAWDFLGVNRADIMDRLRHPLTSKQPTYGGTGNLPPMHRKTRRLLDKFFARYNEDLVNLTGDERFRYGPKGSHIDTSSVTAELDGVN